MIFPLTALTLGYSAWLASPPHHLIFCSQCRTRESQGQTRMVHNRNRPRACCFLGTGSCYPLIVWGQQERERGAGPQQCLRDEHPCSISTDLQEPQRTKTYLRAAWPLVNQQPQLHLQPARGQAPAGPEEHLELGEWRQSWKLPGRNMKTDTE